jgi:hypothetical protein
VGKRTSVVIQERLVQALASLYNNNHLARGVEHSKRKKMLVGLTTMAVDNEMQESLMMSLMEICCG